MPGRQAEHLPCGVNLHRFRLLRCTLDFRFGSKTVLTPLKWDVCITPVCGRLRVGKDFLHVAGWSVRPCVRPLDAVHMTAGHNAFRGSGPDRKPAFENAWG